MKRTVIASFVALSLVAGPALAATSTSTPPVKTAKQAKKADKHALKTAKASARTAKAAPKTN